MFKVTYANNDRHYGYYIDGDIAKLPGGGRRGAAVLCELVPDQLLEDPNPHSPKPIGPPRPEGDRAQGYPSRSRYGAPGGYPTYPRDDGSYPSYPGFN